MGPQPKRTFAYGHKRGPKLCCWFKSQFWRFILISLKIYKEYVVILVACLHTCIWWGFASTRDRDRMVLMIYKLKCSGFLPMSAPSASTLASEADRRLFRAVTQDPIHVLRLSVGQFLPGHFPPGQFPPRTLPPWTRTISPLIGQ